MNKADIKENYIIKIDRELLSVLLKDRSSGKNIIWATDDYARRGEMYLANEQITVRSVSGHNGNVIKPRIEKSKKEQAFRIKNKAEVFTPSWICNKQNNLVDNAWFGREGVFNTETDQTWIATTEKIPFPAADGKTWKDYVRATRLEITCGEAPYLVSRYDTVTGESIDIPSRIGLLDRKLRVVCENVDNEQEWVEWAIAAVQSVYGFDWQGDNVLLARENLLFTFADYYSYQFGTCPTNENLLKVADILSWNIWQMDGLKFVIPNSCKPTPRLQMSIFDDEEQQEECEGCKTGNNSKHTGTYSIIKDWQTNKAIKFYNLLGGKKMKFDFIIGNPPYNTESEGAKIADDSIYHYFIDMAYKLSDRVALITPSKFLFNNGNTPTAWNRKMLEDEHFKVLLYEPNAQKIFPNVTFRGGLPFTTEIKINILAPFINLLNLMNSILY